MLHKQIKKCQRCRLETSNMNSTRCPIKGCGGLMRTSTPTYTTTASIGSLSRDDDRKMPGGR